MAIKDVFRDRICCLIDVCFFCRLCGVFLLLNFCFLFALSFKRCLFCSLIHISFVFEWRLFCCLSDVYFAVYAAYIFVAKAMFLLSFNRCFFCRLCGVEISPVFTENPEIAIAHSAAKPTNE